MVVWQAFKKAVEHVLGAAAFGTFLLHASAQREVAAEYDDQKQECQCAKKHEGSHERKGGLRTVPHGLKVAVVGIRQTGETESNALLACDVGSGEGRH